MKPFSLPFSHRPIHAPLHAAVAFAACCFGVPAAGADIILTEVIANVTTNETRGDVVELFNTGPGSVDLTGWILTDMDDDPIAGVVQDASFAPALLGVPPLAEGEFAVIDLVDTAGTAAWQPTNYGLRIVAPLTAGSFLGS
ncbi:MAG: lamin tail domain-containing protein, partial [Candidatus Binatia bacterium]